MFSEGEVKSPCFLQVWWALHIAHYYPLYGFPYQLEHDNVTREGDTLCTTMVWPGQLGGQSPATVQQYPSLSYKKTNKKEQIKMPVMFYLYVCFSVLYPYEESVLS